MNNTLCSKEIEQTLLLGKKRVAPDLYVFRKNKKVKGRKNQVKGKKLAETGGVFKEN